jgi:Concanavalin A-like lectin/glucanases superfamily
MSRGHIAVALVSAAVALALPSAASASTLSLPLVGWWPMNEGSGQTVYDWSGQGNNGMLGSTPGVDANDPSWIRGVFLGSALNFAGGDYVTIPSPTALQQQKLTVAAWVRGPASPGQYRYVVGMGGQGPCVTGSWGLYTGSGGGMAFYIADTNSHFFVSPAASQAIWDGKWHHVAGTFDGSTLRLFVDGVEVGTGTPASGPIDYALTYTDGDIGSHDPRACDRDLTFNGDVDGVQVWSQALPVDKIWAALKPLVTLAR